MPLASGTRIGAYDVVAKLGEGGMGEVYRARDTSLNRDVAIKVLPESAVGDADRLARFTREAQTLAALNHPNIAQIYGFEAQAKALIMELVEGRDLSAVIAESARSGSRESGLHPDEAVPIARQIAGAMEAAHDLGIIHRDLKPANVKVRADGTVKVLDFGLAKALAPGSDDLGLQANAANSPTLTARATQLGMILGTAAYMSPEQAKGKAVDRRADIWAFGVVLYEMLSGKRAFEGEDASTTMAAVLMKDPEWDALPQSTPLALRQLIRRCVERDPKLRLRDIGEARIILDSPDVLRDLPAPAVALSQGATRTIVPWLVAGLGITVAAIALVFNPFGKTPPSFEPVRFTVAYPPNVRPLSNGSDYGGPIMSPDGRLVAFSAADAQTGKVAIYIRRIDALEATIVRNTDGGRHPFWAPSSNTIAFYAKGKLNRVDLDGGSPMVICDAPTGGWGGAWNKDDIIIAGMRDPGPLLRVSAKGGDTPQPLTTLEAGELDHDWPYFLPDGRHFLYTAWGSVLSGQAKYVVGSLDSTDHKVLRVDRDQLHPMAYADPGFVLSIREGSLMAQRIDPVSFDLQGDPIAIAANASGPFGVSTNGALSYSTTSMATVWNRIAIANRDGSGERTIVEPGFYADPAISPDGLKIAFARRESSSGTYDIYTREIAGGAEQRLTLDPATDRSPVWAPGSDEVIFSSMRGSAGLYRKNANNLGAETLVAGKDSSWPYQWHPKGFMTSYSDVGMSYNVWLFSFKDAKTTPLVESPNVNEMRGSVSPDGNWLVYDARESSRFEVYLDTYPPSGTKLQVTTDGGAEARWSGDGKELFYVNSATGALMVATVTPGKPPTFSAHRQVHAGPLDWGWNSSHSYAIDPKSGRLILEIMVATNDPTVLLNWQGMIKK
jgi:eukaryotic-like serine/threonine-protein kinase